MPGGELTQVPFTHSLVDDDAHSSTSATSHHSIYKLGPLQHRHEPALPGNFIYRNFSRFWTRLLLFILQLTGHRYNTRVTSYYCIGVFTCVTVVASVTSATPALVAVR